MTRKKSLKKRNDTNNHIISNNETATKITTRSGSGSSGTGHVKGLINLGNTCYFNSMLQMILNSPRFMQDLKTYCSADYEMDVETPNGTVTLILKQNDVSSVEKELLKIWESVGGTISPAGLRNALLKNDQFRAHFNGFNEQDSHEAFLVTLNIVRDAQVRRIRKAILDHFQYDRNTSRTLYGADPDSGAAGTSSSPLSEETRNAIRAMGMLADRFSLAQTRFGLVVASALRCDSCGTLRLRFDDGLHLSPALEALDRDAGPSTSSRGSPHSTSTRTAGAAAAAATAIPAPTQPRAEEGGQNRKISKHQLKKQKRIERKAKRIRKASTRNSECSPGLEEAPTSDNADGDTNRVETDSAYDTLSVDIEPQSAIGGEQCPLDKDSRSSQSAVDIEDMSVLVNETALRFAAAVSLDSGCVESIDEDQVQPDLCPQAVAVDESLSNDDDGSTITHDVSDIPIPNDNENDQSVTIENNDEHPQSDANNDNAKSTKIHYDEYSISHNNKSAIIDNNDESTIIHNNDESTIIHNNDESMVTTSIDDIVSADSNEHSVITCDNGGLETTNDTSECMTATTNGKCAVTGNTAQDAGKGTRARCSWDKEAERPRNARAIQEVFQAVLETHGERRLVDGYQVSIPAHPRTDLERALQLFVTPTALDGLVCDSCSRGTSALRPHTKMDRVCHAPSVLPIYISRFKQVAGSRKANAKNNQLYSFPFLLDLSDQCSALANVPEGGRRHRPLLYRLYGIIEHIGARINSGHYVSYVSERRQSDSAVPAPTPGLVQEARRSSDWIDTVFRRFSEQQEQACDETLSDDEEAEDDPSNGPSNCAASDYNWYRVSDSHVESVSPAAVLGCQAFMLFYWRIQ